MGHSLYWKTISEREGLGAIAGGRERGGRGELSVCCLGCVCAHPGHTSHPVSIQQTKPMLVAMVKLGSILRPLGMAGINHDCRVDKNMLNVSPGQAIPGGRMNTSVISFSGLCNWD